MTPFVQCELICSLHAGHNITIKSHPSPLYFAIGTTFNISCSYSSQYMFNVWLSPSTGHQRLQQSTGRYKIKTELDVNGSTNTLTVESARNEDHGEYACQLVIQDEMFTKSINATLIEMVQIITETGLSNRVQLCEHVALNCTSIYHDSVIWRKLPDSKEVKNTSDGRVTLLPDQLVIQEALPEDNGTYTCFAKNQAGFATITAELNIGMYICTVYDMH